MKPIYQELRIRLFSYLLDNEIETEGREEKEILLEDYNLCFDLQIHYTVNPFEGGSDDYGNVEIVHEREISTVDISNARAYFGEDEEMILTEPQVREITRMIENKIINQ